MKKTGLKPMLKARILGGVRAAWKRMHDSSPAGNADGLNSFYKMGLFRHGAYFFLSRLIHIAATDERIESHLRLRPEERISDF